MSHLDVPPTPLPRDAKVLIGVIVVCLALLWWMP